LRLDQCALVSYLGHGKARMVNMVAQNNQAGSELPQGNSGQGNDRASNQDTGEQGTRRRLVIPRKRVKPPLSAIGLEYAGLFEDDDESESYDNDDDDQSYES
jgi:hypothetical protein